MSRRAVLALAAFVLMVTAHARVTLAPGWAVPCPALVMAAALALCAGGTWLAIWLALGFRSSPVPRPVRRTA